VVRWALGRGLVAVLVLASCFVREHEQDQPVTDRGTASGNEKVEGVAGFIRDPAGRPIRSAVIRSMGLAVPSPPIPEIAIVSDKDGYYVWRLVPGPYEISVSAEGYRSASKRARVEPGRQARLDFTLEANSR
jgi:hypothetical protein